MRSYWDTLYLFNIKAIVYLRKHCADFFLEKKLFQKKWQTNQTRYLYSKISFLKFVPFGSNVEKMIQPDRQKYNIIWHLRLACWLDKAVDTLKIWFIYCFPRHQFLRKLITKLRLYFHCLPCFASVFANRPEWSTWSQ